MVFVQSVFCLPIIRFDDLPKDFVPTVIIMVWLLNNYFNLILLVCIFFLATYVHIIKNLGFLVFAQPDSLNNAVPEYSNYLAYDDAMFDMHEKIYKEDLERIYGKLIVVKYLFLIC